MSDNKLKVMHLIWSMGDGGAQQVVINYLRDFNADPDVDLRVYVYTGSTESKYDKEIAEKKYPVTYLNNPKSRIKIPVIRYPFNRMVARREWYKVISEYEPDIVHVHISELLSVTLDPIIKANVPIRFDTLHSYPLRYQGSNLRTIRKAFNKYNFIPLCVTDEQGRIAKGHYGFDSYELVRNGIDIDGLKAKVIDKKLARRQLGISEDAYVVLGIGRLTTIKRFDLLIEAFAKVAEHKQDAILLIAGEGCEQRALEDLTGALKIQDRVRFLGNRNDTNVIYSASDMLGVTSESESASLVLLEAQIFGMNAVISSGVPDESIVTDRVNKMDSKASVDDWAEALMCDDYVGTATNDLNDYDVHHISENIKKIYLNYYNKRG